jgi:hypothetical protein
LSIWQVSEDSSRENISPDKSASVYERVRFTWTKNRKTGISNKFSLSTSLAQVWQSHIPFSALLRCSGLRFALKRGPPADALVMWAATPTLTALDGSSCGPAVSARHAGFENVVVATRKGTAGSEVG